MFPIATIISLSQPNPIAKTYPKEVTGTFNGTLAVVPIPLSKAQEIIGHEYRILTDAYQKFLPTFPKDMYPAIVQAVQDHDVQSFGIKIPDFTRISIEYPFVDLLNDGYTSFRYVPVQAMVSTNIVSILGSAAYGTYVVPSTFTPTCDPYDFAPDAPADTTFLDAHVGFDKFNGQPPSIATLFHAIDHDDHGDGDHSGPALGPYSMQFYINATNQPTYANPSRGCDNMIRFFNTSITAPPYQPVGVKGHVKVSDPFFPGGQEWHDVWGLRLDTAFIEHNFIKCEKLKGYSVS
ncbi:uncharacterized protein J3D65DRAFT_647021 [Phyllosticta citribraziliensis]|uniref:Uncharacterized protein n=1 Tax=Phyllosticta citribraziliensis TaxID=989973 RepID=A0ABR1LGX1_9PEZI